jgi:SOS-response transcriptional repressor LexA
MDIGQIIRSARKAKKLSLEELAHRIGSDSGNLSRFERGLQSTTPEKLKLLMATLDIKLTAQQQMDTVLYSDPNNVMGTYQPMRETRLFPLISWEEVGRFTEMPVKIGSSHRMIESTENAGHGSFWLAVSGHSMTCQGNPSFPEGSLILVKPDGDIVNGKYYVVELLDSGDKTFKQYVEDAGYRYLRPLNDRYRTIEMDKNCRFIGRVVDAKMSGL